MAALYIPSGTPVADSSGSSSLMRDEFNLIQAGFTVLSTEFFLLTWDDFNTAGSRSFVAPFAGTISVIKIINDLANTTTATILTFEIGGTLVTATAGHTIASDQAVGTVGTYTPTATNIVAENNRVEVISNGGGTPVMPGSVIVHILRA